MASRETLGNVYQKGVNTVRVCVENGFLKISFIDRRAQKRCYYNVTLIFFYGPDVTSFGPGQLHGRNGGLELENEAMSMLMCHCCTLYKHTHSLSPCIYVLEWKQLGPVLAGYRVKSIHRHTRTHRFNPPFYHCFAIHHYDSIALSKLSTKPVVFSLFSSVLKPSLLHFTHFIKCWFDVFSFLDLNYIDKIIPTTRQYLHIPFRDFGILLYVDHDGVCGKETI